MTSFSGIDAMHRAQADIGRSFTPTGMCLNHNFTWSGIGHSIGPGSGHYDYAIDAWNYATRKVTDGTVPPPGVPIYFGVSPTRTDRNKAAGDVGWSVGNGIGIFTDANGSKVGPMTIAARAKQTQRPYLGWTQDFLGWDIAEQTVVVTTAATITTPITDTPTPEEDIVASLADLQSALTTAVAPLGGKLDQIITALDGNTAELHQLTELPSSQAGFAAQIDGQYQDVLGRHADAQGGSWFLQLMTASNWNIGQVKAALLDSDEYAYRYIANAYVQVLKREASAAEINGWITWKKGNSKTLSDVTAALQASPEGQSKH